MKGRDLGFWSPSKISMILLITGSTILGILCVVGIVSLIPKFLDKDESISIFSVLLGISNLIIIMITTLFTFFSFQILRGLEQERYTSNLEHERTVNDIGDSIEKLSSKLDEYISKDENDSNDEVQKLMNSL